MHVEVDSAGWFHFDVVRKPPQLFLYVHQSPTVQAQVSVLSDVFRHRQRVHYF